MKFSVKNKHLAPQMEAHKALKKKRLLTNRLMDRLILKSQDGDKSLIDKFLDIAEERLKSANPEEVDKGMKNVIDILPYVVSKEKAPTLVINNDNRKVNGGANVTAQIQSIEEYFKKRDKQMLGKMDVSDVEIYEKDEVEVPEVTPLPKARQNVEIEFEEGEDDDDNDDE